MGILSPLSRDRKNAFLRVVPEWTIPHSGAHLMTHNYIAGVDDLDNGYHVPELPARSRAVQLPMEQVPRPI